LKINYHNSESFTFGMDEERQTRVAQMLNCQVGAHPMMYLGIHVSDKKLGKGAFLWVTEKISKKIPP
jgi:hypothetical protein